MRFVEVEGLFRIQAEADECDALRRQLDSGAGTMVQAVRDHAEAHVLATSLKQWLRQLPEPLVPPAAYRALVALGQQAMSTPSPARDAGTATGSPPPLPPALASGLPSCVRALPQPQMLLLHALVELLEAVAAHQACNRMSAANLALVFAPTLCRAEGATLAPPTAESGGRELAVEIPAAAQALAALIHHRATCFPPLPSVASEAAAIAELGGGIGRATRDGNGAAASAAGGTAVGSTPLAAPARGSEDAASDNSRRQHRASMADDPPRWWYSQGGEQRGPVSGAQLAAMLSSGELSFSTWVFEAGSSDWQELRDAQARLPAVSTVW